MSSLRSALLALTVSMALPLAACGAVGASGSAAGEGTSVVTSIYALEFVAEQVGGDLVDVQNLTQPGQEPHDLELTVRDTAALSEADLAVYLSGFQPAVDEAVEQNGPDRVLDVADAADLAPLEEGHEDEEEGHDDHGDDDPHFWLDPMRMADVADALAGALAEADPDNAATYTDKAATLRTELTLLDRQYTEQLGGCEIDTVVVSHDAFGYLEKYDLEFAPIAGLSPDAEPSPSHLAELQDLIEDEGVTTVFYETLVSPDLAESLAGDLGLDTAVLDPLEGLSDETAAEDYLSLMRSNLAALTAAGGCA